MFIGHFAVGYGAKRYAPRAPLWALMAAPLLADIFLESRNSKFEKRNSKVEIRKAKKEKKITQSR